MSVPPAFASPNNTTFILGSFGSFLVVTVGTPTITITSMGTLPLNVTFLDNGNGSATISGIPQIGTEGTYPLTLTATNSEGSVNQLFTLSVIVNICIHPDMEAESINGDLIKISDIKPGTLLKGLKGHPTKVLINHVNNIPCKKLVKFNVGSLGENIPSKPLRLTPTHPIVINNQYVRPRSLLNADSISYRKDKVQTHTIVTDNGLPIMIYDVPVSTWNIKDWNKRFSVSS